MTQRSKTNLFISLLIGGVIIALSASHIKNEKAEKVVWVLGYGLIIFVVLMAAYNASQARVQKAQELQK